MKGMSTRPEEVARRKERFVRVYAETGNAAAAAVAAGYSVRRAKAQGQYLLATDRDLAARARELRNAKAKEQGDDFVRQQAKLRFAADDAIDAIAEIAACKWPKDADKRVGAQARVLAAIAILDRAGHKPVERIEQRIEYSEVERELAGVDAEIQAQRALASIAASAAAQAENGVK